jgi:ADP-ribosyl-[dinitrogen reductase] hydrolase
MVADSRPIKTSITHPLPLATVATAGGGVIAMTQCPGKRQPLAATGPWDRDLATDLDVIRAFGASHVITLMEAQELAQAQVPIDVLEAAVEAHGLRWLHWPIVDFAAPSAHFESLWTRDAPRLCSALRTGGRIVVHCRGGRGRSGLVAARFLIELGISAEDAIAAVRSAEPLAIETDVQERHVRNFVPAAPY